jgi:dTMP kinase
LTEMDEAPPVAAGPARRAGRFIVVEGGDGAGRSTQVRLLLPWVEELGWAAVHVGLGRSLLVRRAFRRHRRTPEAGVRSLALLYAADLADQLERRVRPALEAGFAVIADRWTATASARCAARGADPAWLTRILAAEPLPDLTVHLLAPPQQRLAREIAKRGLPEFSESGRDLGLDADPLRSFLRYQGMLDAAYERLSRAMGAKWSTVPAGGDPWEVQAELRRVARVCLTRSAPACGVHADG